MTRCDICKRELDGASAKNGVFVTVRVSERHGGHHPLVEYVGGVCDRCVRIAHVTAACFDRVRRTYAGDPGDPAPRTLRDAVTVLAESLACRARDRLVRWARAW